MTKYKYRLANSLFAKVFFLTLFLLFGTSLLVYGILAMRMPKTYSNHINSALDNQANNLISELKQVPFENSSGLFSQFLQNPAVSNAELYTEDGTWIPLPNVAEYYVGEDNLVQEQPNICIAAEDTSDSGTVFTGSYPFSFAGDSSRYVLTVYGAAEQVAQLKQAFVRILPELLLLCIAAALMASLFYAHIITKPVLNLCRISQKMSRLQFDWQPAHTRGDELGILEQSLHHLSRRLDDALTSLQKANHKLAADIEHEKALEQARTDFFSAVSHELKTPVTVIKGQLEGMLFDIGAYQNHKKYLAKSLETAKTLEHMVQEIVTVSRLETEQAFPMQYFDCVPLIRSYLNTTEDLIIDKRLRLCCNLAPAAYIHGNKLLLEKVFSNLIGNAVKYAPQEAEISILLTTEQGTVQFCIENSNTHIPNDCLPKLFDAFYRVEQSRNRKTGGSGLGLYLVQKILAQYGSCCTVCNTPTGVRFSFSLSPSIFT